MGNSNFSNQLVAWLIEFTDTFNLNRPGIDQSVS